MRRSPWKSDFADIFLTLLSPKLQKIRTPDYISFSLCGLIIAFGGGGLILVVSYCQPTPACLRRRKCISIYSQREWATNEPFQLQRLCQEGAGVSPWQSTIDAIPTTQHGQLLARLNLTDPDHPRLHGVSRQNERTSGK